jgi:hypothetical protein
MKRLRGWKVCEIEPGLSSEEFSHIEAQFGFEFADDHRAFLEAGLPVNRGLPPVPPNVTTYDAPWPDWRSESHETLRERLDWPVEGVLLDVRRGFWLRSWGDRPTDHPAAQDKAPRHQMATAPTKVPVHGHRYLPAGRGTHGHPVLSMYQTDIICYGLDLARYIDKEFAPEPRATVAFWRYFDDL